MSEKDILDYYERGQVYYGHLRGTFRIEADNYDELQEIIEREMPSWADVEIEDFEVDDDN